MPDEEVIDVEDLNTLILLMHREGWVHIRREYKLNEATKEMATAHLLEEAVELQASAIAFQGMKISDQNKGKYEAQLEESADVLSCYLHANMVLGLSLDDVVKRATEKMETTFCHPDNWKE